MITPEQTMAEGLRAINLWKERALRAEGELVILEANSLKKMEELQDEIKQLRKENIEHGAKSGKHLEFVRKEINQILSSKGRE